MNTKQINNVLKGLSSYGGTCPADLIPLPIKYPITFVINTDPASERGEHWVAIHISAKKKGIYFDSFGFPCLSHHISDYLTKHCSSYVFSSKTLQHPEWQSCGMYCIAFVRHMSAGGRFNHFIERFTTNLLQNEKTLKSYLSADTNEWSSFYNEH